METVLNYTPKKIKKTEKTEDLIHLCKSNLPNNLFEYDSDNNSSPEKLNHGNIT